MNTIAFSAGGGLGASLLRALLLNSPEDLIAWTQAAPKSNIARLAATVFATRTDPMARRILADVARQLAHDALVCAGRLSTKQETICFVMAGSVLRKQPAFARTVWGMIRKERPNASVRVLEVDGAVGAAKLAMEARTSSYQPKQKVREQIYVPTFDPIRSPTERRNPRSINLDGMSLAKSVDLMFNEEGEVLPALRKVQTNIQRTVALASAALRKGGRIFYVGAGTSGRLGVLDATECPPTFRVDPELVQGIIAGGQRALWQAVEGAEDDALAGQQAVQFRSVSSTDVVIGIAASGRTPFVWGALQAAQERQAKTVLICFNPALEIRREYRPDVLIAPDLGPEVLTGSTRLKCGTATKLILNTISTLSMVRLGKVISNLMIDLNPSNLKLRDRAIRILTELTACSAAEAKNSLEKNGWVVKNAWRALQRRNQQSRPNRTADHAPAH